MDNSNQAKDDVEYYIKDSGIFQVQLKIIGETRIEHKKLKVESIPEETPQEKIFDMRVTKTPPKSVSETQEQKFERLVNEKANEKAKTIAQQEIKKVKDNFTTAKANATEKRLQQKMVEKGLRKYGLH